MAWQFKHEESSYPEIAPGKYRVMIETAEMAVSKAGNDMLVLKLIVAGQKSRIWNYIVFLEDRPEITNRMLTRFFDSFGIEEGDFNLNNYPGHVGAAMIKHDDDDDRAKISYFISKDKQDNLPAWEGEVPKFEKVDDADDELPF